MAHTLHKLTARAIAAAPARAELSDGGGLILELGAEPCHGKWTLRFTSPTTRKRREAGLGAYPAYGLARARDRAAAMREMIRGGVDPLHAAEAAAERQRAEIAERERQQALKAATVEAVAREVHRDLSPKLKSRKHASQWIASLENHVFPTLGARPVATVEAQELLDLLKPLSEKLPETASRLRQRLEAIFDRAVLRKYLTGPNPAAALKRELKRRKGEGGKKHFRALKFGEVPAFVVALRNNPAGYVAARLALEFAILAAARTGEVLGALWGEINEGERVWVISGARMKRGEEHRVFLTPRMLEILREARALIHAERGDDAAMLATRPLFPSPNDARRPLSNMAMLQLLKRMKDDVGNTYASRTTVHGVCRSTFSTFAREKTRFKDSVIEAALAHGEADAVAAAYSHAEYLKERRSLAAQWERFVTTPAVSNIVRFAAKG